MDSACTHSVSARPSRCGPALTPHRSAPMPARVFVVGAESLNAVLHDAAARCVPPKRSRHAVHHCFVLAIRRTLSHNRDEFENGMWRQRASDARAVADVEAGGERCARSASQTQTPRRRLVRFEAVKFRAAWQTRFSTRTSARDAVRRRGAMEARRGTYVKCRAYEVKKPAIRCCAGCAPIRFSCTLRT